jgi:hypothetical protein
VRSAWRSFTAANEADQKGGGRRAQTYREALQWLEAPLKALGARVPPSERDCELERPAGFEAFDWRGDPLADDVVEVERLLRSQRWSDAVMQLEQLRAKSWDHMFEAVRFAEPGARLARAAGASDEGRAMLELVLNAYEWFASGASSGAEGLGRMVEVERVRGELKRW